MTDWNLEGSEDAVKWVVLHEARIDRHIANPTDDLLNLWESQFNFFFTHIEVKVKISEQFVERELRHTWQIDSPSPTFFRYFRIIGSGTDYERHVDSCACVYGAGLELYGDVHED
jgi:hypothetical protein